MKFKFKIVGDTVFFFHCVPDGADVTAQSVEGVYKGYLNFFFYIRRYYIFSHLLLSLLYILSAAVNVYNVIIETITSPPSPSLLLDLSLSFTSLSLRFFYFNPALHILHCVSLKANYTLTPQVNPLPTFCLSLFPYQSTASEFSRWSFCKHQHTFLLFITKLLRLFNCLILLAGLWNQ